MSVTVQFAFRIRTGYRNEIGYAERTVREQVERAGGSVDRWIDLTGDWDGQALATFPFDGAAKLTIDEIETLGAIVEFAPVQPTVAATDIAPASDELSVLDQAIASAFMVPVIAISVQTANTIAAGHAIGRKRLPDASGRAGRSAPPAVQDHDDERSRSADHGDVLARQFTPDQGESDSHSNSV